MSFKTFIEIKNIDFNYLVAIWRHCYSLLLFASFGQNAAVGKAEYNENRANILSKTFRRFSNLFLSISPNASRVCH